MPNTPPPPAVAPPRSRTPSPPAKAAGHAVTELLRAWSAGDAEASDSLVRLVYEELRRQARRTLRREGEGHTLQPTALVHEAWLRLGGQHEAQWESRTQFFALAARMMRRVLVDHARTRRALKRGGAVHVTVGVGSPNRVSEAAEGASPATVGREWAIARMWLRRDLEA